MTPRHPHETPAVVIDQLFRSSGLTLDWRAVAIKQALIEAMHTLASLLHNLVVMNDAGETVQVSRAEIQLLQLIPALLRESVVISHRELVLRAIQDLQLGCPIDLHPLIEAAIADLQQLQAWAPQIQEGDHDGPSV